MIRLLNAISPITVIGSSDGIQITGIEFDSRRITPGTMFVAIRGTITDGHQYIGRAIESGACVVVCEELPIQINNRVLYLQVADSSLALAHLAIAFYDNPSSKLCLVGVTGTNGKTTTATLLHQLFTALGYQVGLLSTVVNRIGNREIAATHTTPDPLELNRLLDQMVIEGCQYCFMEVSSHSVVQKRIEGLTFRGGIFTNLTHDHLDYHGTFRDYLNAKKAFFDALPRNAFALTNTDDRNGDVMLQNCKARHCSYSLQSLADYHAKVLENHLDGTLLELNGAQLWVKFIGRFNAYNLTAIYGTAIELDADSDDVLRILSTLDPVAGRFETIRSSDGKLAIVDYAHTPDALQNVLSTIQDLKGGGRVITVVGCGGDRDTTKRPVMARIAVDMSDQAILTSDNPRTEDPQSILDQMASGLDPVQIRRALIISDRRQAIRTAVTLAKSGDIILIAGKGHETYQEINGIKHHFDDCQEVRTLFE